VNALLAAGYPYELAGLAYYGFFIYMNRPKSAARYSRRSRLLVVLTAIAMVGCVPFHYASDPLGMIAMLGLGVTSLLSTFMDGVAARRP
jgi:hypothetical protein